ncbi:MAG: NAD(P)-dependent oxidoreductase [Armatimonadetes bacterium]|nr:NAD(P)-dependent oxidoreductase [Armatimonadota bacterium]
MKVLVTGASGNAGQAVCQALANGGTQIRMADVVPPPQNALAWGEFVRYDTRTPEDARQAVAGMDAVIHLAAWHCAHVPPVSDATIFDVNVNGTFHLMQACREQKIQSFVWASSMAYGWGGVYGVTKVIGEDLCRMYNETTGASVAMLRYHDFVPKSYLAFGAKLLRNAVDRRDVADATVAALYGAVEKRFGLFRTIVHSNHHMTEEIRADFGRRGAQWCEANVPGATALMKKYNISLPGQVEQHDLSEAKTTLGWEPQFGFVPFLEDLQTRDARGENIHALWTPSDLSVVTVAKESV